MTVAVEGRVVRSAWRTLLRSLVRKDAAATGAMVALFLPPEVAAELALPGGEAPDQLHITLAYLGEDAAAIPEEERARITEAVGIVAESRAPLAGVISGSGRFNGAAAGGKPVVYATADLPGLVELRQAIIDAIGTGAPPSTEHDFTPHITLAYGTDELPDVATVPLTIGEVVVVFAGERTPYPLGMGPEAKAARLADALEKRAQDVAMAAARSGLIGTIEVEATGFDLSGRTLFIARSGEADRAFVDTGTGIELLAEDLIAPPPYVPIVKSADAQRYTLGVVYPAKRAKAAGGKDVDSHGDFATPEEVELAAWRFMSKPDAGLMHRDGTGGAGTVVESYVYRGPTWKVDDQVVEPGDWLLGVVWSPEAWAAIERGELTGYSLQGYATREDA